jgi:hypothetical protein
MKLNIARYHAFYPFYDRKHLDAIFDYSSFFFELFYKGYATSLKVGIVKSGKTLFVFANAIKRS